MEPISTPRRDGSPMRLVDHLQEKQESFKLEAYLIDRGYSSKNKLLKKRSGNVVKCLEIRNVFCKKLVMRLKRKGNRKEAVSAMEELESLSSASSSISMDGSHCHKQANELDTDRMIQWRNLEEKKQNSPDSVLDQIEQSPIYNVGFNKQEEQPSTSSFSLPGNPPEESILSATLWELIIRREKPSNLRKDDTRNEYINSKKALQQTRQLLFECVREAVESEGMKEMKMKTGCLMGPEKLGMIICDKMRVWSRQSANRRKINQLLRSDFMGTIQNWDNFECFREDIVIEVGDEILEEIKDELVEEVIDLYIC